MAREFDSAKFAAQLRRTADRESIDDLAVRQVFDVAAQLRRFVKPWGVYDQVTVKVARAIVERKLSPVRVGEIIEATIVRLRMQKEQDLPRDDTKFISNPGGYFINSIKAEFQREGIPWHWRDRKQEDEV